MKIIKPDNLALLFSPCMIGDNCCLSVAAMACFSLEPAPVDRLLKETAMWKTVAAELGEEEALDTGYPKKRGEFLVYGSVPCAPGGNRSAGERHGCRFVQDPECERNQILERGRGSIRPGTVPGDARSDGANAFGGRGWEPNPVGIGLWRTRPAGYRCRRFRIRSIRCPRPTTAPNLRDSTP